MFAGTTIVFDLDGTLVDTAPDLTNALNDVRMRRGHEPVPIEAIRGCVGHGARVMIEQSLTRVAARGDVDRMLAEFLAHYETNIARESRPYPGAFAALDRLVGQGARLAICTNKRASLSRLLLQKLGIEHYFTALAGRDTFPVAKPHRRQRHRSQNSQGGRGASDPRELGLRRLPLTRLRPGGGDRP